MIHSPDIAPLSAGRRRAGFTLVEILIVVTILGLLAAIVVPQFATASNAARQSTFASNIEHFARAAEVYMAQEGQLLEDSDSGQVPTGFENYIDADGWTGTTVIGGVWDADREDLGVNSAIGVHFNGTGETRDDAYMTEIDRQVDDGDLSTGAFRKLAAGRYYMVLR